MFKQLQQGDTKKFMPFACTGANSCSLCKSLAHHGLQHGTEMSGILEQEKERNIEAHILCPNTLIFLLVKFRRASCFNLCNILCMTLV